MKLFKTLALAAALSAALPTAANAFTLDFEGVGSFGSISGFYNGGTDIPTGGTPATGANYGVFFSPDALALSNDELGPYFSNAPTAGSVMFVNAFATGGAYLNSNIGFSNTLSFYYSAITSAADVVRVWSGLNGTGSLLASINLAENNIASGCSDALFCNWTQVNTAFSGVGMSIDFGANTAANGNIAFDNISVTPVPEPGTYALMFAGLGLLGAVARRRKQADKA